MVAAFLNVFLYVLAGFFLDKLLDICTQTTGSFTQLCQT